MNIMSKNGFTLIELLVVISIISLLTTTILFNIQLAQQKARNTGMVRSMQEFQTALELYRTNHEAYPLDITSDPEWGLGFVEWEPRWESYIEPELAEYIAEAPRSDNFTLAYYAGKPGYVRALLNPTEDMCILLYDGYFMTVQLEGSGLPIQENDSGVSPRRYEIVNGDYDIFPATDAATCSGTWGSWEMTHHLYDPAE